MEAQHLTLISSAKKQLNGLYKMKWLRTTIFSRSAVMKFLNEILFDEHDDAQPGRKM
jgi:hypothetical protein